MSDEDDDQPRLSEATLAALLEFYGDTQGDDKNPENISEDWQLSQFWYDEETASSLAQEMLSWAKEKSRIACISSPTVFKVLHQCSDVASKCLTVNVFEYDERFKVYGDSFVFYDYQQPLNNIADMSFDVILIDPPFLSEECLEKCSMTVKAIAAEGAKILLCTGAVMEDVAARLLNVKPIHFIPKHNRNLANEFRCYTNFDPHTL